LTAARRRTSNPPTRGRAMVNGSNSVLESMMASLERLEKISTEYDRCRSRAETYRT
jgi:hypothetical protein